MVQPRCDGRSGDLLLGSGLEHLRWPAINPIGRIVGLAVLIWQFLELIEVITSSWRGNIAKLIWQARRERRHARRDLKLAIVLLPPAPPYTTFHRFGPERDKPPTV